MKERLENLVNCEVEVVASKVTYRGILKEVSEEEVQLLTETGWVTISMEQVNLIRRAGETPGPDEKKDIPPDFYDETKDNEGTSRKQN